MLDKVKARFNKMMNKTVIVVSDAPRTIDAATTLALAGSAADSTSKVLMGVGAVCGGVALVAASPVVSKVALCASAGCFMSGFVRGFRKSMNEV